MLHAFAQDETVLDAERSFESMVERNHISWNSLLHAYVIAKKLDIPCRVFFIIPQWCVNSWTSMLVGFYQAGDLETASIWFERMLDRNVVSWNVMICANARSGDAHQALRLLKLILLMPPPVLSLNPCAAIPDLAQGKLIHSTIPGKIFLSDIRTSACMAIWSCGSSDGGFCKDESMIWSPGTAWCRMLRLGIHSKCSSSTKPWNSTGFSPTWLPLSMVADYAIAPLRDHYVALSISWDKHFCIGLES
ncbi:hypothetical protein SELMODRAFT_441594 [Selaginella moellendorffii]|uniref:Pentatricopeptide repeat-containing protein n=1 Tax=Selaginella moellendorffii TaxID=88036 RepID=D8RKX6_SELML|nr:hypothetical protein SELMODRAFT_441594 [Selaginella moellendorffii]